MLTWNILEMGHFVRIAPVKSLLCLARVLMMDDILLGISLEDVGEAGSLVQSGMLTYVCLYHDMDLHWR